jgi:glutamine synthetase
MLTLEDLGQDVDDGAIDTVVAAFTDMQGRLMGKREQAEYFLDETAEHGLEGCNYLLGLDMEMDPQPGYAMASWERGYGDFHLRPDLDTLRRIPWLEGTALVLCDVAWEDGSPVVASPRQVLKGQVEHARAAGYEPMFGSELEFYLLKESYAEAHRKHYRDLTPSVPYILDYHVLATTYDEPLIRQIRNGMQAAGIPVESSKGEAWPGQQEINFRYADALTMADRHTVYKNGAKEIAQLNDCSITFMAKPDHTWIGNSCHIHASLWRDGENAFAGESEAFKQFLAGWIACAREVALFLAPTINSYKRYAAGSWAPTTLAWGHDNRTCGFRIV